MAHSMGGEVSLHLAAMAPEKIQQLILVGSAGFYEEGASTNPPSLPLFVYREIVQNYFIQRTFFFTAYSEYERQNGLVTTKDFDEMYLVNRTIPAQILRQFGEDNDSGPMQHIIDQVEHPTLLIWGEMDGFIPYATGEKLAESLGENAQLVKMNLAGHLPFDTFFDSFIQHVEEFIT
jgi:pimeloyl-ACP methyl ester carboxylesterase